MHIQSFLVNIVYKNNKNYKKQCLIPDLLNWSKRIGTLMWSNYINLWAKLIMNNRVLTFYTLIIISYAYLLTMYYSILFKH